MKKSFLKSQLKRKIIDIFSHIYVNVNDKTKGSVLRHTIKTMRNRLFHTCRLIKLICQMEKYYSNGNIGKLLDKIGHEMLHAL